MGKDGGVMTPKAIAKRIKSKGLQKLRWYCQMCEKQCRDENGFKCHCESRSHQRQLELFAENPQAFIEKFSRQFKAAFLDILRHRFGTTLIKANTVYQEYIKDKYHVHMNATQWVTLGEFVRYLGREGICKVEEREEGWYMRYIDREEAERSRKAREIERQRLNEERRSEMLLKRRLNLLASEARENEKVLHEPAVGYKERPGHERIAIKLDERRNEPDKEKSMHEMNPISIFSEETQKDRRIHEPHAKEPSSALQEIRNGESLNERGVSKQLPEASNDLEQIPGDDRNDRQENWIMQGLVVKVMNKKVRGGTFYKKKGVISSVEDEFTAIVRMKDNGAVLRIDQDDLETVIPNPGGPVMIVNGRHRGERAYIERIDIDKYVVQLKLLSGKILDNVEYEDVCRESKTAA